MLRVSSLKLLAQMPGSAHDVTERTDAEKNAVVHALLLAMLRGEMRMGLPVLAR